MLKMTLNQAEYEAVRGVIALIAASKAEINNDKSNLQSWSDIQRLKKIFFKHFNFWLLENKSITVPLSELDIELLYRYFKTVYGSLEQNERIFIQGLIGGFDEYLTSIPSSAPEVMGLN